jgi:hypothetical protein
VKIVKEFCFDRKSILRCRNVGEQDTMQEKREKDEWEKRKVYKDIT